MTDGISREDALKLRDAFDEYRRNEDEHNKTLAKLLQICVHALKTGDADLKRDLLVVLPQVIHTLEQGRTNDPTPRTH